MACPTAEPSEAGAASCLVLEKPQRDGNCHSAWRRDSLAILHKGRQQKPVVLLLPDSRVVLPLLANQASLQWARVSHLEDRRKNTAYMFSLHYTAVNFLGQPSLSVTVNRT